MKLPNSTERLRAENRSTILRTLRDKGPIARIQLSELTGLSPAAITGITRELLEQGLLVESESADKQSRGRPRVMIDIQADAARAVVAVVSAGRLELCLYNLKGHQILADSLSLPLLSFDAQSFENRLIAEISAFMKRHRVTKRSLLGIGLALQGMVDRDSGRLFWSPVLGFKDHALQPALSRHFKCDVELINDANAIAIALRGQSKYRNIDNFASIMLGVGVGMGVFINGRLYQGRAGSAAEFGHLLHDKSGPECRCGKHGCIEAYISDYALLRDCGHLILDKDLDEASQLQYLRTQALSGNKEIQQWYSRAGHVLGTGVSHVINLLAPEQIVLSSTGVGGFSLMEKTLQESIDSGITSAGRSLSQLTIERKSSHLIADGAARRALSSFYFAPLL